MSKLVIKPFLFKDELDILEIQLEELYNTVDYFVIIEGELSFQGYHRPGFPFYENNISRFKKYEDKIIYCKLDANTYPESYTSWSSQQRRDYSYHTMKHLVNQLNFPDDTIVLFGDCDEIPRHEVVHAFKNGDIVLNNDTIIVLQMNLYYFYFNYICKTVKWNGFKALTLQNFLSKEIYNQVRCLHDYQSLPTLLNCGWHYSYFGDVDFVINKLSTTCDGTNLRNDQKIMNRENIADAMKTGRDIYFRHDHHWEILPIDNLDLPHHVTYENDKYKQYFNI